MCVMEHECSDQITCAAQDQGEKDRKDNKRRGFTSDPTRPFIIYILRIEKCGEKTDGCACYTGDFSKTFRIPGDAAHDFPGFSIHQDRMRFARIIDSNEPYGKKDIPDVLIDEC